MTLVCTDLPNTSWCLRGCWCEQASSSEPQAGSLATLQVWWPGKLFHRKLDVAQPVFLTHTAWWRSFINWGSEAKEGIFLAPEEASQPAPRQTRRLTSWALLKIDLHWTKLIECVLHQICSLLLTQRQFCSANFHSISAKR